MITWDEVKRNQVIKVHGVDFAKLGDVLDDPFAIDYADDPHSSTEDRRVIVGRTSVYGMIAVVYVARGEEIRFITARRAERWMVRMYEKQRKRS